MELSAKVLSEVIVNMKYARYLPMELRRETWEEIVTRNKQMHIKHYPKLKDEIEEAYKMVYEKKVLPSMRSLQYGGKPIEINPTRVFNCSYLPIDDWQAFQEILFLLLSGTGVGYSVQKHHVEKLPQIKKPNFKREKRYLVGDSVEGWADAIKILMKSYFFGGYQVRFDYSDVRHKGADLVTSGGKAPGPEPLSICIEKIKYILNSKKDGEQLTTLEVHDIICHIADSVLSGGLRRAALIALFSVDDNDMIACKSGEWWNDNPQRGRANNSAVLVRSEINKDLFLDLWKKTRNSGSGEPGVFLTNNRELGTNPSLRAGTKVLTSDGIFPIEQLEGKKFHVKNLNGEYSRAECFLSGRQKELWKVKLQDGKEYYATAEHEWPVINGNSHKKVKTDSLKSGDNLPMLQSDELFNSDFGTNDEGFLLGWLMGDGYHTIDKKNNSRTCFIASFEDAKNGIKEKIDRILLNMGVNISWNKRTGVYVCNTTNKILQEFVDKFGYVSKEDGLPSGLWKASEEFRKGFVDGLMSSDGWVSKKTDAGNRMSLVTKHKKMADDFSDLLGFYGVPSSVSKSFYINNGKRYHRYAVRVNNMMSVHSFRNTFELSHKRKQKNLDESGSNRINRDITKMKIVSVKKTNIREDVWDITVHDTTHCFQLSHCVTGNCAEISLKSNGFCNLTEINASDVTSQEDLDARTRVASFIGTLQAGYTDFHYLRNIWRTTAEEESLLGVGMTGIASGAIDNLDLAQSANVAKEENERVAKLIGINRAARVTCVKPSGCRPCDALTTTTNGIYTLDELFSNHEDGKEWCDYVGDSEVVQDGATNKILKTYYNGKQKIYGVELEGQLLLESTENHPWFVSSRYLRQKSHKLYDVNKFIPTNELSYGDIIDIKIGVYKNETHSKLKKMKTFAYSMKHKHMNEITQPDCMDEDLAWLIGYLWGDGSIDANRYRIRFTDEHEFNIDKARRVIKDKFGLDSSVHKHPGNKALVLEICSSSLYHWLSENGIRKYSESYGIDYIPLAVRKSSWRDIIAFIAGFADADGSIIRKSPRKDGTLFRGIVISQSLKSGFTRHLQNVALAVGIHLNHSRNAGGDNYQCIKSKKDMVLMSSTHFSNQEAMQIFAKNSEKAKIINTDLEFANDKNGIGTGRLLGKVKRVFYLRDDHTYDIHVENDHWMYAGAVKSHNTSSLVLGSSSGIHAWHSKYYIRRLRVAKTEAIYNHMVKNHPEIIEDDFMAPHTTAIISVPIMAPDGSKYRTEDAIQFLERVKWVYDTWVKNGHNEGENTHNVSSTVSIKEDEWDVVIEWLWNNRDSYSGVSVIPHNGGTYVQMPFEECTKEEYEERVKHLKDLDLTKIVEYEDMTTLIDQQACQSGACEIF